MENLLQATENARAAKTLNTGGLHAYVQTNCQVTLTDNGYRIYRPPNLTVDTDGRTMWGGLVLKPYNISNTDVIIKDHTYILKFHVKGQSSNACEMYWSNEAGWTGGAYGLGTNPTIHIKDGTAADFNGEKDVVYKFTVSDEVYKTCTTSYSSFVAGTSYNCYRDFKYGWSYSSTGTLGTDVYITNIRMYDITDGGQNPIVLKTGVVKGTLCEDGTSFKMDKYGELSSSGFIED